MQEENNFDIKYEIDNIVKQLEEAIEIKFKLANTIDKEYISIGQVTEEQLLELGFRFIGYSSYVECPIYRYGKNIEAIFNENILNLYSIEN